MSIVAASTANRTAVKPYRSVCYNNNLVTSQGVFLGDKPLSFSLPLLLLEIPLIFITSTAIHRIIKPLGQSRIVSHILTGILLGRSVIGRSPSFRRTMFPTRGTFILDTLSLLSLILFLFSIGVKTDLSLLRKPGRKAVVIGIAGSLIPLSVALTISRLMRSALPTELRHGDLIFQLVCRLSHSAFPVVADALEELSLLNSGLGRTALSASLIADIINSGLLTFFEAYDLITKARSPAIGCAIVASLVCFVLAVAFIARPAAFWVVRRCPPGELLGEGPFLVFVIGALVSAYMSEVTGYHPTMGPFLLGLALPGGMPLGVTMTEKLDSFLLRLFLPLYLVLAGYRTDFSEIRSFAAWGSLEIIFVVCYLGKILGTVAAAAYFKMPMRDALTVGLMMNIKGLIEVSFFNSWGDTEMASAQHFSVLMVSLLLNTAITTPLIKILYNPTARYVAHKRRTIQHAKPGAELRVLACVHNEDHVAAFLDLLEASHPTTDAPISVFLLHLRELAGRAVSILRPHKKSKHSSSANTNPTASDRIANAFRYFEQQSNGAVSVHPYVAIAPYTTMFNDVCSLALDKKTRLIILPFHKQSDGARETSRNAFQSLNRSVLDYAPCSVAILVDRGIPGAATCTHTNHLMQRIAVYFLGGADDREALAYGMQMAGSESNSLSVVRFVPRGEPRAADEEGRLDEEMLGLFRERCAENNAVVYGERLVGDGEGTVAVIRSMSEKFDLLIVGRRKGEQESELTSGLSEWSECPELGLVGDMIASTDFGGKVSILVVQQQERARAGSDGRAQPAGAIDGERGAASSQIEEVKDVLIHREG